MSEWFEIKNQEDVELSEDGTQIEVLFNSNEFGNQYIEIPIEFIYSLIGEQGLKKEVEDADKG